DADSRREATYGRPSRHESLADECTEAGMARFGAFRVRSNDMTRVVSSLSNGHAAETSDSILKVRDQARIVVDERWATLGNCAISDQVPKEFDPFLAKSCRSEHRHAPRNRNMIPRPDVGERLPTVDRQERMRKRRSDSAAEPRRHIKHGLHTVINERGWFGGHEPPLIRQREEPSSSQPEDIFDRSHGPVR